MSIRKNIFISHHHKNDRLVDEMTTLLHNNGCEIRNSSIRAKPANQERLDKGLVKDSTVKRLLKMKISWAGTIIVLISKETHTRPWVNWEIKEALRQGKNIVGVYEHGLKDKVELPDAFKCYGTSLVSWRAEMIISAINGNPLFQDYDGSKRLRQDGYHGVC